MLGRPVLVLLLTAGLGAVTSACDEPDQLPGGAASDAAIDATPAMIRVTVFDETAPGTPAVGARVVFQAPDHTIQTIFTGADGTAEAVSPSGTTVTAIQDLLPNPGKVFTSFRGLAPGMSVVAGPPDLPRRYLGSVPVSMPQVPNGMYYEIRVPCAELIDGSVIPRSVFVFAPCTAAASATLVGRVRDANHQLLGVSVLDGVNLPGNIDQAPIALPPYTRVAVPLTADIDNIPASVDHTEWEIFFKQRSESIHDRVDLIQYLETESASSTTPGHVTLQADGYPVGDETLVAMVTHPEGYEGAYSNYVSVVPGQATHFTLDASGMIRAFDTTATVAQSQVTWNESSDGASPALIDVAVEWGDVRGTIYGAYTGPSVTFDDLPGELISTDPPALVSLASYSADGLAYGDLVQSMREYADYWEGGWSSAVPALDTFWTSVYHGAY